MILLIVALTHELSSRRLPEGVQLIHCGVGKINAALATSAAIARLRPSLVINYGTAGAVSVAADGLLEVASVLQRDMNTEPLAPRGVTPFDDTPVELRSGFSGARCASGDSFVTAVDPWLQQQGVDIVDMELFAIAMACRRAALPWRAFKFVTDAADGDAAEHWNARVGHGEELLIERLAQIVAESPVSPCQAM